MAHVRGKSRLERYTQTQAMGFRMGREEGRRETLSQAGTGQDTSSKAVPLRRCSSFSLMLLFEHNALGHLWALLFTLPRKTK